MLNDTLIKSGRPAGMQLHRQPLHLHREMLLAVLQLFLSCQIICIQQNISNVVSNITIEIITTLTETEDFL